MNEERRRTRYLSDAEGAPPLPPPGGYRGASRLPAEAMAAAPLPGAPLPPPLPRPAAAAPRARPSALGWIALVAVIVFAVVLLIMLAAGATDALYSATLLALQLVVVGVVVAAVATARGRRLGAAALTVTLLLNVGTVGALSALRTSATGAYDGAKSDEQRFWEAFPGIRGTRSSDVLSQPSLEEVRAASEAMLAEIRAELTARYGYTWVRADPEGIRPERNGYGGESMLKEFWSASWTTVEPIRDEARKREVLDVIDTVIARHGFWGLIGFNEPSSGIDPSLIEKLYGSADPSQQPVWEWFSDDYPGPMRFYTVITDLSLDTTGEFRAAREGQRAGSTAPLEGIEILVIAREVLREADRAAFEDALKPYPPGS